MHGVTNAAGRVTCALLLACLVLQGCGARDASAVPSAAIGAGPTAGTAGPLKRGKITLYDDTFGDPVPDGITAGPDGALWFTDPGNDTIGRITTAGAYTLEQPPGTEVSSGITVGRDGNLWFTLQLTEGGIGRITPTGKIKLFKDPGGSYTNDITTGPDGALWFAEYNGTIGRMSLNGKKVKHFTVSSSNAELLGIATGPDGNLWVTEFVLGSFESNFVYRVTPKGAVTSFKVGFGPAAICAGPDGAMWFAESGGDSIGRLTTSGQYTSFKSPDPNGFPYGIAAGPDHALWFTNSSRNHGLGRITTSGKITLYKAHVSFPGFVNIAAGPDGAMWFTATNPPAIGRVTTR